MSNDYLRTLPMPSGNNDCLPSALLRTMSVSGDDYNCLSFSLLQTLCLSDCGNYTLPFDYLPALSVFALQSLSYRPMPNSYSLLCANL